MARYIDSDDSNSVGFFRFGVYVYLKQLHILALPPTRPTVFSISTLHTFPFSSKLTVQELKLQSCS